MTLKSKKDWNGSTHIGLSGAVLLSVAACGPADSEFVEFDTFHSPNGKHRVIVETASENSFAFSPEAIRFYLITEDTSARSLLATTSLANDGGKITNENISAEWIDANTLRLCLSAVEQDDEAIVIDAATASVTVESARCVD